MVLKSISLYAQLQRLWPLSPAHTTDRARAPTAALCTAALIFVSSACSGAPEVDNDRATAERPEQVSKTAQAPEKPSTKTTSPQSSAAPAPAAAAPPAVSDSTIGGDGSAIQLRPLTSADVQQAGLTGELGCSFSTASASPLLLAMGDAASTVPATGVVKIMDSVELVVARTAGGFDAILKGGTFVGQGKVLRVTLAGAKPVGGGESPAHPATLTYDRADGARRTVQGLWSCGP